MQKVILEPLMNSNNFQKLKKHPNLQMTGNHLFELLYRGSSSGFVKECDLFLWLQLISQLIVQDVTQMTLDDTIMITPAACIDLRATEEHTHDSY